MSHREAEAVISTARARQARVPEALPQAAAVQGEYDLWVVDVEEAECARAL